MSSYSLYNAASDNDIERVKTCLAEGANVNWSNPDWWDNTPLHIAAAENHVEVINILLTQ